MAVGWRLGGGVSMRARAKAGLLRPISNDNTQQGISLCITV